MNKVKGKLDELSRERTQLNVEKAHLQKEKEELQQQVEELARSVEKLNRDKVVLERELEAEEEQVRQSMRIQPKLLPDGGLWTAFQWHRDTPAFDESALQLRLYLDCSRWLRALLKVAPITAGNVSLVSALSVSIRMKSI